MMTMGCLITWIKNQILKKAALLIRTVWHWIATTMALLIVWIRNHTRHRAIRLTRMVWLLFHLIHAAIPVDLVHQEGAAGIMQEKRVTLVAKAEEEAMPATIALR